MSGVFDMDLAAISAFVSVGSNGGFRAAAASLGMTSAGVSKAVARLEAQLGVTLVARTTRSVRLTSAGAVFHARCRAILADLAQAGHEAAEFSVVPGGRLTVSVPMSFGRMRVVAAAAEYVKLHPQVEVEIRLSDRVVDLVEDGVDLAVRIGHLPDSGLVATRVADTGFMLCGSPGYLGRAGVPTHPDELARHDFVGYVLPGTATRFVYRFLIDGVVHGMTFPSRLTTDDGEALVSAAMQSVGLIMVADYLVDRFVADGRLVRVLREFEVPPVPISVVRLPARSAAPAAQAFTTVLRHHLATAVQP
jgi:LysR family transcriptional regulator, regulator for bpeEF and oprC